jgi:hypothetical protein
MNMPSGVPQGNYPVRTSLYLNGQRVAGKDDLTLQVVSLPDGQTLAMLH